MTHETHGSYSDTYNQPPAYELESTSQSPVATALAERAVEGAMTSPETQTDHIPTIPWRLELSADLDFEGRREALRSNLEQRINDAAFDRLVALYGETLPVGDPTDKTYDSRARLVAMSEVAAREWDFRRGKSRQETDFAAGDEGAQVNYKDPEIYHAVQAAAREFGMTESSHVSRDEYNGLVEPGGVGTTPLLRLLHAVEQKGPSGEQVKFEWIALLGSDRRITETERAKLLHPETGWEALLGDRLKTDEERAYLEDRLRSAETEFDLMSAAGAVVLDGMHRRDATLERVGYEYGADTTARVGYYQTNVETDAPKTAVFVLNAPIPEGQAKAGTPHTYDLLQAAAGNRLSPGKEVLVTSTGFVAPFQYVDAQRLLALRTGVSLEGIGYSKDYSIYGTDEVPEGKESLERTPQELLQEVKSYIGSLRRLQDDLDNDGLAAKLAGRAA